MTTTDGVLTVQRFVRALRAGDYQTCYSLFDRDAVIDEAKNLPFGGVHRGPDVFRGLARSLAKLFTIELGEPMIQAAGPRVILTYEVTLTSRATDRCATMPVVDLFTVRDGLITHLDVFYKDTYEIFKLQDAPH